MSQNKSDEETWLEKYEEEFGWSNNYWLDDPQKEFFTSLLQQERQTSQEREREIVEAVIADYMDALGTVVLPEEIWLWIADINGKYLNKTLKENI